MNENDKVMTENFTKRFVDHGNVGLAPESAALPRGQMEVYPAVDAAALP